MSVRGDSGRKGVDIRWKWLLAGVAVSVVTAIAVYAGVPAHAKTMLRAALELIKELGSWGPALFILLYIASCVALLPGSILTVGGGALFGVVLGSIYVSIGATLGATAAFLVGRYLARDWVTRKIGTHPTFIAIDKAVTDEGWRIVFLTRLCPLFPFFLMNYAYGLTRVSLRHYVLATWIGIIPGSTLFVYVGSLANGAAGRQGNSFGWAWKGFILITAILAVAYITKVARRSLSKRIGPLENESDNANQ